jgi:hypothetical protein
MFGFQVITRVMVDLCGKHLEGLMAMYVDDMLGVAHREGHARRTAWHVDSSGWMRS